MKLLGDLPDHLDGGEIVRDAAGKPTGVFVSHLQQTTSFVCRTDDDR